MPDPTPRPSTDNRDYATKRADAQYEIQRKLQQAEEERRRKAAQQQQGSQR